MRRPSLQGSHIIVTNSDLSETEENPDLSCPSSARMRKSSQQATTTKRKNVLLSRDTGMLGILDEKLGPNYELLFVLGPFEFILKVRLL